VILTGSVSRVSEAAAELCDFGPIPKPYEPKPAADRIKQLMALRAARSRADWRQMLARRSPSCGRHESIREGLESRSWVVRIGYSEVRRPMRPDFCQTEQCFASCSSGGLSTGARMTGVRVESAWLSRIRARRELSSVDLRYG
jgi:hypothetical protein